MIKIKENTITAVFGENQYKASIGITAKKGTITLQELCSAKAVGDKFKDADINKLPKIELQFSHPSSIDAMIKCLETIKSNYIPDPPPYDQYAYAC